MARGREPQGMTQVRVSQGALCQTRYSSLESDLPLTKRCACTVPRTGLLGMLNDRNNVSVLEKGKAVQTCKVISSWEMGRNTYSLIPAKD